MPSLALPPSQPTALPQLRARQRKAAGRQPQPARAAPFTRRALPSCSAVSTSVSPTSPLSAALTGTPQLKALLADVVAGVSVAFVAVPQSLAYASLAGLPPTQGLHTNAVASFPAAAFASSKYLQIGAVAMSSLLTGASLSSVGLVAGTPVYVQAATLLALLVGVARLALGVCNGAALLALIPAAVLDGFMTGVVWTVAAAQVPLILGLGAPPGHYISSAAWCLLRPASWHLGCLAVTGGTLACVLGGKRLHPLFPGALLATALACIASVAALPVGPLVGAISATLPAFIDPATLPWHLLPALAPAGAAIALAGFAEAAAISARFAAADGEAWDCNKELVAHGASNVLVAAVGGFPVSGSLSRTALARAAGARSQLAHLITGLAVLVSLSCCAPLLASLPKAALGGLVVAAMQPLMVPPPAMRQPSVDAALGWVTLLAALALSPRLEQGLLIGVLASALAATLRKLRT